MTSNALEISQKLIAYPSVTPAKDTEAHHVRACTEVLDYIQFVTRPYTHLSRRHVFSQGSDRGLLPIDNLWLGWKCSWGAHIPRRLLYIGHADVVTVKPELWTSDPFTPRIANGRLYGRGATDMKGPLAAFLAAMNNCVASNRPLHVEALITTDEERFAVNGIKPMLEYIKDKHGIWYDAVLVGEPSSKKIATGRRGSLNVCFTVTGKAGHCAYGNSYVNPTDAALALGLGLKEMVFITDPAWLAKTELVVRDVKTNSPSTSMVASVAQVFCNIRYTGNYTPQQLIDMLKAVAVRYETAGITIDVKVTGDSNPYLGIPKQGRRPELLETLQTVLIKHTGHPAEITNDGATSDARWVPGILGDTEIIEFGPDTTPMHADDESIAISDLESLQSVLEDAIPQFCQIGFVAKKHVA